MNLSMVIDPGLQDRCENISKRGWLDDMILTGEYVEWKESRALRDSSAGFI